MMGVQSPRTFLLLSGLNGLGAGCIWPAIYAAVADTYQRSQRGLIMGLLSTVMLGGLAMGPITGNLLLGLTSYRATFLICIALVFLVFVIVLSLATETKMLRQDGAAGSTEYSLRPVTGELVLLGVIALLLTVSLAFLLPIISLYGAQVLLVDKVTMGIVLAIPGGITALALLTVCFGGAPVTTNLVVVTTGATVAGLGYALAVPAWNALAMDRIPERTRGLLLGAVATVQGVGLAIGPVLGGYLWEQVHHYAPFLAGALLLLVATGLSLRIGAHLHSADNLSTISTIPQGGNKNE